MNILHIITGLSRGGAEAMLYKLLQGSSGGMVRHAVISLGDEGAYGPRIRALGIDVYTLNMRGSMPGLGDFLRLRQLVRQCAPTVIHGWMYHGALAALTSSGKAPVIVAIRQSLYDIKREKLTTQWAINLLARLSARAAAIVYCSTIAKAQHEARGYCAKRGLVIPNGFDINIFKPNQEAFADTRRQWQLAPDQIAIIQLARFHPMKGHANLLEAASLLRDDAQFVFVLAGLRVDASTPAFSGLDPTRFRLLGERTDAQALLAGADILVNPSSNEAFPNVVGEAMACAVPCVVTNVGDSAFIVGDTGFVVPPENPQLLADSLRMMAALPTAERRRLGERARERVIENFTLPSIVEKYLNLYRDIEKSP